jgi:GT2 family glycosyltransferase
MTAENTQLTFAIPYYSNVDYLRRAVESVFAQTDSRWRLVISEDVGPEPLTSNLSFLNDPRVTWLRAEKSLGLVGNFNKCLDSANTALVTILHADDELEPTYAEKMISAAHENGDCAMFFCGVRIINAAGEEAFSFKDWIKRFFNPATRVTVRLTGDAGLAKILRANFIFCPSICLRSKDAQTLRFSSKWMQVVDVDLFSRILFSGRTILGLPDRLFRYRRHAMSITERGSRDGDRFAEEFAFYQEMKNECNKRNWHRAKFTARWHLVLRAHVIFSILRDLLNRQWGWAFKKVKYLKP